MKAVNLIFLDEIPDSTIASFLSALTFRGVSANQLKIIRDTMLQNSLRITPRINNALIDNCGTGGDLANYLVSALLHHLLPLLLE